ncbi:cysteine hydrolase [Candidatus Woesearchaeota archaeon]|nr:cysteine hydrolase [Candidatus Woesearchaeota archaeon]
MVKCEYLEVDPQKSALLVIDVQYSFCSDRHFEGRPDHEQMAFHVRGALNGRNDTAIIRETVEEHIAPFVERARQAGLPIGFVQSCYNSGQFAKDGFGPGLKYPDICVPGTPGWEFYHILPNLDSPLEAVLTKWDHDLFEAGNNLDGFFQGKSQVVIVGLTTDNCVQATAYGAIRNSIKPIVLKDGVSTSGHKMKVHYQTLKNLSSGPLVAVADSKDIYFSGSPRIK